MGYAIHDLELTESLPRLVVPAGDTGFAAVLRRRRRPVGYLLEARAPGSTVEPDELATLIGREAGARLLEEALADELRLRTAPAAMPPLTVAICTRGRPALLDRLLASLLPALAPARSAGQTAEVLVVDNAPSDGGTRDAVLATPGVRYEVEPRPGLDFARNRALEAAAGEWIAYLDDDVVVDRGWLDGLREAWLENPDAGAFTGLVLPYEMATEAQEIFERRGGFRRGFDKVRYGREHPTVAYYPCGAGIFGAGCNMAFRCEALRRLGGFDEALDAGQPLPGGGDMDAFYRVVRAGLPLVYEPSYLVFHQHRRGIAELRRQYWSWGLGTMAFVAKTWGDDPPMRPRLRRLVIWWAKYQLKQGALALFGRRFPVSMVATEVWGGLCGLFGEYGRSKRRVAHIKRRFQA